MPHLRESWVTALRGDITLSGECGAGEAGITRTGDRVSGRYARPVDVELDPPQPEPVAEAIADALALDGRSVVDPWWRAGIEENLRGD